MSLQNALVLGFGGIGILWYYTCLLVLGLGLLTPDPGSAAFRDFMSFSLTTLGVSLATFVGMLLGLRGMADEIRQGVQQVQDAAPVAPGTGRLQGVAQGAAGTLLQWVAALLYALSLLLALFFWWYGGNTTDPALINLGKSLIGLIGGALSVLLNLPR